MSLSKLMPCRSVCGVVAAVLLYVGFTTAFAGVNAFTPLGPEGGPVSKVEFHPTDGAVAYLALPSGFYRSSDSGVSWRLAAGSPEDHIVDFAIDPNDGNRVFVAAINYGLFVSTDAGATLSRLPRLQSIYGPSNVEMSRDGTLYATADMRIFRSTNGGVSWQERTPIVTSTVFAGSLRVDPLDSNGLYVFSGTEGSRSTDGGASWSSFSFPASTRDLVVAAVTPQLLFAATFDGVMVSSNGGTNWSPAGLADATLALAIDPANAAIVYAGTYPTGLFRTSNQGGQWTNVHGNARSGEIASIALSPVQPGLVLLGGIEGLARSITAGPPWTSANSGFVSTSINRLIAVPSSQRIYAASTTGGGVFAFEHGSASFEPANIGGLMTLQPNFVVLDLLAQGLPPDRLIVASNGGYALSLDGGEHWQFVSMSPWNPSSGVAGSPIQPQNLIGSGHGGLRYSLDGGIIWTPSNGLPPSSETGVIEFAPSAPSTAYAAPVVIGPGTNVPQGIYKSTNGGADWVEVNTGIPDHVGNSLNSLNYVFDVAVDPRTEQTAYAGTGAGLFKTVDGGTSWSSVNWASSGSPSNEVPYVAIDPARPDTVYAARYGLVRRSVDAGVNWDTVATAAPGFGLSALLVDPVRKSTLVIGTYYHGAREMTVATDVEIVADLPSGPVPYGATPTAHSYTVRNLGLVHASDVRTVIQLSSSAGAVAASATAGSCTVQGAAVTCLQPILLAGRATQITVSSTHAAAGNINVQASVQSYEPDAEPSNNSVQGTLQVAEVADLSVTASAPATITAGSAITYSVVVTNAGPNAATAVTANVQLAAGLTVATAAPSRGSCTSSGTLATCLVGDLAGNSSATITITTAAASSGTFQATATVAGSGFDAASANNTAQVSTTANALPTGGVVGSGSTGGTVAGGGGGGGGGGATTWPLLVLLLSAAVWRRLSATRPRST